MKKYIITIICLIVVTIIMTGCGNDKINYSYKYDIYVNGKNINSEVITSTGYTKSYIEYVNHTTYTTDLELTFVIYESPIREKNIDAEKLLRDSFNVETLYNKFDSSVSDIEKVKINGEEYNKYSITYDFNDISRMDIVTINFGSDVIKNLNLNDDGFDIKFIV